jgi:DinB superfamily
MKPLANEHIAYYQQYIDAVEIDNLNDAFVSSKTELESILNSISDEKAEFKYAENKWTVKQLLLHLIDCERIFSFRALAIARGEHQNILGYDENVYAENCGAEHRTLASIIDEYLIVRQSSILLFTNFNNNELLKIGLANNANVSVRALGFVILGHQKHHFKVLAEKYLS